MSQHTTLYRLYDTQDRLLYVGIAGNPGRRFEQHASDKPWWGEVARTSLQHFATRADAAAAEMAAIRAGHPIHNIIGRVIEKRSTSKPPDVHSLTWSCGVCKEPVTDGSGYIEISCEDHDRWREETRGWREEYPGGVFGDGRTGGAADMKALMSKPRRMKWWALHAACDYMPDRAGMYWFTIERARTLEQLFRWTLHLSDKQWVFRDTNWRDFVAEALSKNSRYEDDT